MKQQIPTEIYSRVVGYFRPVKQWNKGKQEEFRERRVYNLPLRQAEQQKQIGEYTQMARQRQIKKYKEETISKIKG